MFLFVFSLSFKTNRINVAVGLYSNIIDHG